MSAEGFAAPINMPRHNGERAQYGTDASLAVEFFKKTIFLEGKSKETGKPEYEDQDYIRINMGNKSSSERRVRMEPLNGEPSDPERFPGHWNAFQRQQTQAPTGFALENCAWLPKAEVMNFKARNIHTAEQLAGVPDNAFDEFGMGIRKWRDMALDFMKNMEGNKDIARLSAENSDLRADVEMLKKMLAEQKNAPSEVSTHQKGK